MEDVKNLKVKVEIEKIKHCFTTGECGDRTEPGVFYDGNDLAWRNGVLGLAKLFFGQIWGEGQIFFQEIGVLSDPYQKNLGVGGRKILK